MFKYFLKYKKRNIIILSAIIVLAIILISIAVKSIKKQPQQAEINYQEIKDNFDNIFSNQIYLNNPMADAIKYAEYKQILYTAYNIKEKNNKYEININIPKIEKETNVTKKINKEINSVFTEKAYAIMQENNAYTKYNLDYVAYINNDICSLIIKCVLKNGDIAQRLIFKTYNYDMKNDKLISLEELIQTKNLSNEYVQNKINEEIITVANQYKNTGSSGYNLYKRDVSSNIYKIENTTTFFLGKEGYLYIIYSYGNNNNTSEKDLVVF